MPVEMRGKLMLALSKMVRMVALSPTWQLAVGSVLLDPRAPFNVWPGSTPEGISRPFAEVMTLTHGFRKIAQATMVEYGSFSVWFEVDVPEEFRTDDVQAINHAAGLFGAVASDIKEMVATENDEGSEDGTGFLMITNAESSRTVLSNELDEQSLGRFCMSEYIFTWDGETG